jgi:hypothetical protein
MFKMRVLIACFFFFAENNGMVDAMQWGGIRNLRSGIPSICHLK